MNNIFSILLSITMITTGFYLLWKIWRFKYDSMLAKTTDMNPKMGKIDEISEVQRRLKLLYENSLELIAMSKHTSNARIVFKPDYIDPIIEMMSKEGLMKSVYIDDSMMPINEDIRKELLIIFGHTHMANIIRFAHAIDENGKLVISADAVNFLTTEYDPVLLNPENIKQKVSM